MELKGKKFKAIMATPAIGKSYICDRYEEFVDCDELRLFTKYFVPENITRDELEATKSRRKFKKKENWQEELNKKLLEYYQNGKILIFAPHPESRQFLIENKIPYLFVYPRKHIRKEIKRRMESRGNLPEVVKENDDKFYEYYKSNNLEPYATVKFRINKSQYLIDVLKISGINFDLLTIKNKR